MTPPVPPLISGPPAVTAQLSPDDRSSFEHLLGQALVTTAAVQWATRQFAARMRRVVVGAAAINGTAAHDALLAAFAPPGYYCYIWHRTIHIIIITIALADLPPASPDGWGRRLTRLKLRLQMATYARFGGCCMR
jgi:hypothetical protein